MGQDAHPKNVGSYLNNQKMKLFEIAWIHDQTHVEFLIYKYFRKIHDIIEIKLLYKFSTKGANRSPFGAKRPPRYIVPPLW